MTGEDFKKVLESTFNPEIYSDVTPNGKDFIRYYPNENLEKEIFISGLDDCPLDLKAIETALNKKIPISTNFNTAGIKLFVFNSEEVDLFLVTKVIKSAITNPKGTFCVVEGKVFDNISGIDIIDIIDEFGGSTLVYDTFDPKEIVEPILKVKRGFASTMVCQMQNDPIKFGGVHGIQVYDLIVLCRSIIQLFNDKVGSTFNANTIKFLKEAIKEQEARTIDRKSRLVEGYNKV